MKKIISVSFLIAVTLLFSGCFGDDVDIKSNRRLLVQGKITDSTGVPIPNITVVTSGNGDKLGQSKTDANGDFYFVSLDEKFDPLDILINVGDDPFFGVSNNPEYSTISLLSEERTDRLSYNLGTFTLSRKAKLDIILDAVDENSTIQFTAVYTPIDCRLPLMENTSINCNQSATFEETVTAQSANQFFEIRPVLGSFVILEYSANGGPIQTTEIFIDNEENSLTLQY
ncbi:carboxypeptidase-like regulatory domain-containing protein [Aequorivita echinoideorum]|uniref:Carboxypeptidase regulatory-like domain-containing protein n=1 Tax=Aequorivita echinoideorum TaxID=1549647 RepID=A0ABS5S4S6_9FLAO|nr:carboxypeptidase-like regulatory domain-containing protein [Aequorivita echinoideorum]MBT0608226.1 hypothetical protein [Aequorivita echinoideorum]